VYSADVRSFAGHIALFASFSLPSLLSLLALGCSFSGSQGKDPGDPAPPWWDAAWTHRRRITVETGPVLPDRGYQGYTVALPLDTSQWPASADCADLRLLSFENETWTELPIHVLGCGAGAELRFALPGDLPSLSAWSDAYLYYGNPAAPPRAPLGASDVYLWWDDASADRGADYARGRMDAWSGAAYDNTLMWNPEGYYTYANPNDSQGSYRRAVDERDVLVEAEWFHTGCQQVNMQSGVCLRGVIATGAGATEDSSHYYCSSRAQNPTCSDADQAIYDGDIVKSDNEIIALANANDPPAIVPNQWRKQALAAFGASPTQLRFWDSDNGWPRLAAPPADKLAVGGVDPSDFPFRGFAGLMTSQDSARVRNFVVRRYVEPEPTASHGEEESPQ
jgi:hypothetical protein